MTSLNVRCKSAILAAAIAASSSLGAFDFSSLTKPSARTVTVAGLVTVWALWIRLTTKGSNWDYTIDDWRADFEAFLNSYNIFNAESRATLMKLFDKWIVGRQLAIIDITYREKDENGMVTTRKDKKLKTRPFGLMGLFDAYLLCQFKKTNELLKEVKSVSLLMQSPDPIAYILPDKEA
jgi:hypothetical protein